MHAVLNCGDKTSTDVGVRERKTRKTRERNVSDWPLRKAVGIIVEMQKKTNCTNITRNVLLIISSSSA